MGDSIFKPDDFETIRVEINGHNLTSGVPLKISPPIEIQEIGDENLVVSMVKRSCAKGHQLDLDFVVYRGAWRLSEKVTAKVIDVDSCDGTDRVRLNLIQYDKAAWSRWIAVMSGRQDEVQAYFKIVKGEE